MSDDLDSWRRDASALFEGWDFSYLKDRMVEAQPPWDYVALARDAVARAQDILDVATGGGEVFAALGPFPARATAVEGFEPNLAVARARLEPLGVPVYPGNTRSGMPFHDQAFDLVLNRHGGFRAAEMGRILKPGGVFLTQQVGGDNLADLAETFGTGLAYPDNTPEKVRDDLLVSGFEVQVVKDWRGPVTFLDVGAVVYFLKAIPWVVPDFDVVTHVDALRALQTRLETCGPLQFTYTRFLIEAVKR